MECNKCGKQIKSEEVLKCAQCHEVQHFYCVGLSEADFKKILPMNKPKWKCPTCKQTKKLNSPQITLQKFACSDEQRLASIVNIDAAGLIAYMDQKFASLSENLIDFKQSVNDQLSTLNKTVNSWEQRVQELENKTEEVLLVKHCLTKQGQEISSLKTTIASLSEKLNAQEQFSVRNELEISGIPESGNENLLQMLTVTAHKIGMELNPLDIDMVTRVGSRPKTPIASSIPRPIVVRFIRNNKRNEMLQAARVRRNLSTEDIDISGPASRLYFNERLTKENRKLFHDARTRAKLHNFKYCWVKNGLIFIRKEDQKAPKLIRGFADIERLIGPPAPPATPPVDSGEPPRA